LARKQLSGVELVLQWNSLGGALAGVLRALGEPSATPWVMGISGLAFRLALPLSGEELAEPGADACIDIERAARLIRHLGRKVETVHAWPNSPIYAKRRAEAVKRIHTCIDRGVPAIVYDLHLPQFGLVLGYDDKAGAWQVATVMSGQYGGTLALGRWPVPERPGPVLAVLLGGREKVDQRYAVAESLRFAVDYAAHGDPRDPSGAAHGLAAYTRWAEAFARGEPVSAPGNALLVQMLQSARRDAAAFLRGDASRLLSGAAGPLARAASAYDAEVLALSRMVTMFPFPSGGDPASPAARVVATAALREALAREQEALSAIREALARLEVRRW
jgi:hypothetical protein